jgi:hypothetical protein
MWGEVSAAAAVAPIGRGLQPPGLSKKLRAEEDHLGGERGPYGAEQNPRLPGRHAAN